jgi:hypothetical protein
MYPYRDYIETLLSYGPAANESHLTGVMWYKDTPGQKEKTTMDVHFHFFPSDGVFTAGLFQCFHVTHSNGGTQLYLSHIQSHLTMAISEVIWDSTSVPEKCLKTKEIPFREKIMPKETPCLDLISHRTVVPFSHTEPFP